MYHLFYRGLAVFIVLDLSKPEELWNTLEVLLKQVSYGNESVFMKIYSELHVYAAITAIMV